VTKVVELKVFLPTDAVKQMRDLESLRTHYGFYYISKIQYGAMLDIKITLNSSYDERGRREREKERKLKWDLESLRTHYGFHNISKIQFAQCLVMSKKVLITTLSTP
jgi:hypothetical protein